MKASLKRIFAVFYARSLEYLRDRSSFGWNVLFPVFVIFGFAFAFSGDNQKLYKMGVVGDLPQTVESLQYIEFVKFPSVESAIDKVRRHQIDLLLNAGNPFEYYTNENSPKGYMAERLLLSTGLLAERKPVTGEPIRYVDWLIAGLLSMNIMFAALFGVGYVIVRYRKNGVLKRLKATPLRPVEFLSAQVISRLCLLIAVNILVFVGCNYFIQFRMQGSYLDLFLVMLLGTFCLITLGLVVAARSTSEEFTAGILNFLTWPMMFLSGVWFSIEGMHPLIKKLALVLPLTHMIEAARSVMTEGATLMDCFPQIAAMSAMSFIFLMTGALLFRWE